ncbi:MAG: DUF971 domain-containing protein [Candidatus Manganitrophaceae bacterium]
MIAKEAVPTEIINLKEKGIQITWSDRHQMNYPAVYLRESCRCASCIHEWSGENLIPPGSIPTDIKAMAIEAVGHYAISIRWSDGHETGIYAFDFLKEICPCAECVRDREKRKS